jgi:hypothetical protein
VATARGVAPSTIHRLINDGIIAGEQITPGAPWRVRLTDELKARFNCDAGEGFLPMREAIPLLASASFALESTAAVCRRGQHRAP